MNTVTISVPRTDSNCVVNCLSLCHIGGEKVQTIDQGLKHHATFEETRPVFVDQCYGFFNVTKAFDDACFYLLPVEENALSDQHLRGLLERHIYVITPLQDKCRKEDEDSFFHDGKLVCEKFSWENLTPKKMAAAGLSYKGHNGSDDVGCRCHTTHIRSWEKSDQPETMHFKYFGKSAINVPDTCPQFMTGSKNGHGVFSVWLPKNDKKKWCDELLMVQFDISKIVTISKSELENETKIIEKKDKEELIKKQGEAGKKSIATLNESMKYTGFEKQIKTLHDNFISCVEDIDLNDRASDQSLNELLLSINDRVADVIAKLTLFVDACAESKASLMLVDENSTIKGAMIQLHIKNTQRCHEIWDDLNGIVGHVKLPSLEENIDHCSEVASHLFGITDCIRTHLMEALDFYKLESCIGQVKMDT